MKKLIAGNWKMNGSSADNTVLLKDILAGLTEAEAACDVAVCVPAPYLAQVQTLLHGSAVQWGGQDVSRHEKGAYTGEVSAAMLRDFGCQMVLVGHSERRQYHAETDDSVAAKAVAAIAAGLTPVVCVGETLEQRDAGQTQAVVQRQLAPVLEASQGRVDSLVVAYEPVWAIGTGRTAAPEQAAEVHAAVRSQLLAADATAGAAVRILYGGSMKPGNAAQLLAQPDIDGGLIGGAALKAADFLEIIRLASVCESS